ncbi:MAG: phospholipase D family protein [Nitrospinae bacterium]|nr:phospholipase D family protein [Nitrospinota bacterium]
MKANAARKAAVLLLAAFLGVSPPAFASKGAGNVEVYFSPRGGVTGAIVREIDGASKKILVQAYSFTSKPIANALIRAERRGAEVTVIIDGGELGLKGKPRGAGSFGRRQKRAIFNAAWLFKGTGIRLYADDKHEIAHNKVIIIDDKTLITGSFNFTRQAEEENAENLLVIKDNPALVEKYVGNFNYHLRHSLMYGAGKAPLRKD